MSPRRVPKPWGYEDIWAETSHYVGKFLVIRQGAMTSRQYHERKEETISVLSGEVRVEIGTAGETRHHLRAGDVFHVAPGVVHRFCAEGDDVHLVEVSTPHLDDVIRLADEYARPVISVPKKDRQRTPKQTGSTPRRRGR